MKLPALTVALIASVSLPAVAKNSLSIEEAYDISSAGQVQFEIPVGSLDLRTHNSDEIIIEVRVKEQEDTWFSSWDLDDIHLEKEMSGDSVRFFIDADNAIQEWRVIVPSSVHLDIDVGVGEVDLEDVGNDIFVEVGVGEVDIDLDSDDYGRIDLDSGVGAADLSGFKNVDSERRLISESTLWRGNGSHEIRVEVGVGEIDVNY